MTDAFSSRWIRRGRKTRSTSQQMPATPTWWLGAPQETSVGTKCCQVKRAWPGGGQGKASRTGVTADPRADHDRSAKGPNPLRLSVITLLALSTSAHGWLALLGLPEASGCLSPPQTAGSKSGKNLIFLDEEFALGEGKAYCPRLTSETHLRWVQGQQGSPEAATPHHGAADLRHMSPPQMRQSEGH